MEDAKLEKMLAKVIAAISDLFEVREELEEELETRDRVEMTKLVPEGFEFASVFSSYYGNDCLGEDGQYVWVAYKGQKPRLTHGKTRDWVEQLKGCFVWCADRKGWFPYDE